MKKTRMAVAWRGEVVGTSTQDARQGTEVR